MFCKERMQHDNMIEIICGKQTVSFIINVKVKENLI